MKSFLIGKEMEQAACEFLRSQKMTLIVQNYRCFCGEIDLIMQDQEDIVFVEVRSRTYLQYGNALESINNNKVNKLIKTALHFLQAKKWLHKKNSRFDVIVVNLTNGEKQLEWIKNAFTANNHW